jgi:gliding motility-associated-like protein
MKKQFTTLLLLLLSQVLYAQKQNNNWCFSRHCGIDFNPSTPTGFTSACNANEGGAATVSSRTTGKLLFYTDGVKIWDRTHKVMPNGANVGNDPISTSAQGSLIIPYVGDTNKYHVFTMEPQSSPNGTLFVSTVDMKLNGGLGDVITGQIKVPVDTGFAEGMTYTTKVECQPYYWLLLSRRNSHQFYAYKVTKAGIATTPVISTPTFPQPVIQPGIVCMKISSDNKRVLYSVDDCNLANWPTAGITSFVTMYDFDEQTGIVSNCMIIENPARYGTYYGCTFSPDGSKAYVGGWRALQIYQYDVTLPTAAAIRASRQTIYTGTTNKAPGDLQLGPDSSIYITYWNQNSLDKIINCNSFTPTYIVNAVTLTFGATTVYSLPQTVLYLPTYKDYFTKQTAILCKGEQMTLEGIDTASNYLWQDGSTADTFIATSKGTYWVKSVIQCSNYVDTFSVEELNMQFNIPDTSVCVRGELTLTAPQLTDSTTYLWNTGSTQDKITITQPGKYFLTASSGNCVGADTIQVELNDEAVFELGEDTTLCAGIMHNLKGPANANSYIWNTDHNTAFIDVDKEGLYSLSVHKGVCDYADTINITYEDGKIDLGNDSTLCYGDRLVLNSTSLDGSTYTWSNGWKEPVISITQPGKYWVSVMNRCGKFADTLRADFNTCRCNYFVPTAFTPNNDGLNDKVAPILDCSGAEYSFRIVNRFGQIVFESKNPMEKWDGTFNGQPAEIGVYFYLLQLKEPRGKDFQFKGDITLIR